MIKKEKNGKPEDQTEGFNLEDILQELGSFGKYQLLLLLLLAFRDSFLAMCNFHYVFTASQVMHRCEVPECEFSPQLNTSWTTFALSNDTGSCYRMEPFHRTFNTTRHDRPQECAPQYFHSNRTIPCERIVYEDYNSIAAEFDLGCEPWKRTLVGTVHNLGLVFSFIICGFISDRYGRKVIIVGTPMLVGTAGIIKSFSTNYWMLLVLEFLETALGYGNASMILSLELVSHKQRVVFSCILDILTNFGSAFFGVIAWKVPYWRTLMRLIYAPLLVAVLYIFLVDEGVRWLLAHNKKDEAVRVLNKVAKINKITLSHTAKAMLTRISEETNKADKAGEPRPRTSLRSILLVLRSRTIVFRLLLMGAMFFCSNFVYTGAIINAASIFGNKYINFSLLYLFAMPTRVITALTLTRFGRRRPICAAYCLCALFFVTSAFVPKSWSWCSLVLYVLGKMCSCYGMFSVMVVAMEVFPTHARNSLTNIANTVGRIGSVVAPQAPLLDQYMSGLPCVLFGLVALGPALLALLLPECGGALPDDVQQAEAMSDVIETQPTSDQEANS